MQNSSTKWCKQTTFIRISALKYEIKDYRFEKNTKKYFLPPSWTFSTIFFSDGNIWYSFWNVDDMTYSSNLGMLEKQKVVNRLVRSLAGVDSFSFSWLKNNEVSMENNCKFSWKETSKVYLKVNAIKSTGSLNIKSSYLFFGLKNWRSRSLTSSLFQERNLKFGIRIEKNNSHE